MPWARVGNVGCKIESLSGVSRILSSQHSSLVSIAHISLCLNLLDTTA